MSGSEPTTSSRKSTEAHHSRMISPPSFLAISTGSTSLPRDFDIAWPFSSKVQPGVTTPAYVGVPSFPIAQSREDWNHPRNWSAPSRYKLDGHGYSGSPARKAK